MASLGSHCEECPEQTDRPAGHDRHKGGAEIHHRCDRTEEQPSQDHFNYNHLHHSDWSRLGCLGPPEPHNALILLDSPARPGWDHGTPVRSRCYRRNQEAESQTHSTHTPQAGTHPSSALFRMTSPTRYIRQTRGRRGLSKDSGWDPRLGGVESTKSRVPCVRVPKWDRSGTLPFDSGQRPGAQTSQRITMTAVSIAAATQVAASSFIGPSNRPVEPVSCWSTSRSLPLRKDTRNACKLTEKQSWRGRADRCRAGLAMSLSQHAYAPPEADRRAHAGHPTNEVAPLADPATKGRGCFGKPSPSSGHRPHCSLSLNRNNSGKSDAPKRTKICCLASPCTRVAADAASRTAETHDAVPSEGLGRGRLVSAGRLVSK